MERILPFDEALAEVLRHASAIPAPSSSKTLPLLETVGRILSAPVRAERDQPPFARSTRDGYALRASDLHEGASFRVIGTLRAGEAWSGPPLAAFQTLEIMTGAPLPSGADAVLMVEHTDREGDTLHPNPGRTLNAGENVVPQGAEARAFSDVIPAGQRLGAAEIALAAACGCAGIPTFTRPRVAIIATGDELVELGGLPLNAAGHPAPELWQIRNSNTYALAALVSEEAGEPVRLPIAPDNRDALHQRLHLARQHDLILFSGGVSMGKYDLVEPILAEAGAEFLFTGALIQPGKPVVFGRLPKVSKLGTANWQLKTEDSKLQEIDNAEPKVDAWTYFFGLPGNPVSTEVCFRLFVAPLLRALSGQTTLPPRFSEARLAENVRGGSKVTRFLPAIVTSDWQRVEVRPVPWQGSGDLAANARANGFVVLPAGVEHFKPQAIRSASCCASIVACLAEKSPRREERSGLLWASQP